MLIEQVDAVGPQPPEHALDHTFDVCRTAVEARAPLARFLIDVPAELGRDHDLVAERIARAMPEAGMVEALEDLFLRRYAPAAEPLYAVSQPSLCVIAQGSEIHLGERRYRYDPFHYLLVTAELPVVGQVLETSEERPFLDLVLTLDATLVSSVMVEAGHAVLQNGADVRALDVSLLTPNLLNAVLWLVRLLEVPGEVPVLAPLIRREIVYRLLQGGQGSRLRHIAMPNGSRDRIAQAVRRLHESFDQPLRSRTWRRSSG